MVAWGLQTGRHLFLTAVAVALLSAGVSAQSVAGVAKKNKEQSKDKKARVVITDQTLKSAPAAGSAESAAAAPVAAAPSAPPGDASKKAAEREEKQAKLNQEYAGKYRKLLLDLKNAEARQQEAQSRYAFTSAASWQRKAKEQREKMDALREEGRKAGVEPGVFRQVEKNLERLEH
jgi:hypothetical protein